MRSRQLVVCYEAPDPGLEARFWAGLLDREVVGDGGGVLLPGGETQVGLRFVPGRGGQRGGDLMHLHLTSTDLDDQRRTVETALKLGASHLDVGQLPEEEHVVLADPAGYGFCVIEPGNGYLAGCGMLGEVTCDGSREVGAFWGEALGWPRVWDQGEQIAIQSPHGGTKVAWDGADGSPAGPRKEPGWQRFELTAGTDRQAEVEVERLVRLGAVRLDSGVDGAAVLADPDGNAFLVRAG